MQVDLQRKLNNKELNIFCFYCVNTYYIYKFCYSIKYNFSLAIE